MENRKLKIAILVLSIILVGYIFKYPPTSEIIENPKTDELCLDYASYNPSQLSKGLINDMVSIYRNNQLKNINSTTITTTDGDAHSIWFDLDSIKKFIYHIEKGVEQNKTESVNKLGLRFYYAAYPDKKTWGTTYKDLGGFLGDTIKEKYEKLHTLVILPTRETKPGEDHDFNPFDAATFANGLPKYENEMPKSAMKIPVTALTPTSKTAGEKTGAKNHGTLIPPDGKIVEAF